MLTDPPSGIRVEPELARAPSMHRLVLRGMVWGFVLPPALLLLALYLTPAADYLNVATEAGLMSVAVLVGMYLARRSRERFWAECAEDAARWEAEGSRIARLKQRATTDIDGAQEYLEHLLGTLEELRHMQSSKRFQSAEAARNIGKWLADTKREVADVRRRIEAGAA